jgi:hypothetical protein
MRTALVPALAAVALAWSPRAEGQACCAGSSALTPGRLAPVDDALVGAQLRASAAYGSFDRGGRYATNPEGTGELDFEQDAFGAVRLFKRGQAALLVPLMETRRRTPSTGAELGGGIGDVNASARWDFYAAGQSRIVPGIAVLAGLTLPTGRAADEAKKTLATDATGVGAVQLNAGLALEQSFGPWLFNLTGLVAKRATRTAPGIETTLDTQFTALAAAAYSFPNDAALALLVSFSGEGDATVNGMSKPGSSRRIFLLSASGLWPVSDHWRLQGALFLNPPVPSLGVNVLATAGFSYAIVRSWG